MNYQPYIIPILLFSMINGIFSPFILLVFGLVQFTIGPIIFIDHPGVLFYLSSLFLSTLTMILGGLPAALYERWKGLEESSEMSMYIWMTCTAILSLPAAINFFEIGL